MISLCAYVRWPPPQGPGLRACPNYHTQRSLFFVQVWSLTKFYRLSGSQIANLTLDSKLTPVLCHHWQVGNVGCGHGVWTPVMKIHGDKVWKKNIFFICFLRSFCLNLSGLWKSLLDSLAAKKRIAWCGRSGTNSRDPEVKGMVEMEIIIISNGNSTEWSAICICNRTTSCPIWK